MFFFLEEEKEGNGWTLTMSIAEVGKKFKPL